MASAEKPTAIPGPPFNAEEFYQYFINESPYVAGDSGEVCESSYIEWLNPQLIQEGKDFIKRNSFSISLAHIGALLYGFSFKSLTSVLLRTGGFGVGDSAKSMMRHLETGIHVEKWYETDFLGSTSEAFKDIQYVRKLHFNALRRSERTPVKLVEDILGNEDKLQIIDAINKDLNSCCDTTDSPKHLFTYHPKLFFSQYDMAMTQWGFFSIIFLFPSSLGVRDTRGMEGFLHTWAVIGRMLGIEDRFNLALHPNRDLHLKLFYKLGMGNMKDMDVTILTLQQTYADALSRMMIFTTLKASFYFGLQTKEALPNCTGENLYALMTWRDKLSYKYMQATIFLVYHVDFVRKFMNFSFDRLTKLHQKYTLKKSNNSNSETNNSSVNTSYIKPGKPKNTTIIKNINMRDTLKQI